VKDNEITKVITEEDYNANKDSKGYVFIQYVEKPPKKDTKETKETKDTNDTKDTKDAKDANPDATAESTSSPSAEQPKEEPKVEKVKRTEQENKKVASPLEFEITPSKTPLTADMSTKFIERINKIFEAKNEEESSQLIVSQLESLH